MRRFLRNSWIWLSGIAVVLIGLIVYLFTRKKYDDENEEEPILELHNEALEILDSAAKKDHKEIKEALASETPEDDLSARINSRDGPL